MVAVSTSVALVGIGGYGRQNQKAADRANTAYFDAKDQIWGKLSPSQAASRIEALSVYPMGAPAGREILLAQVQTSPQYQELAAGIPLDSHEEFLAFTGYHLESERLKIGPLKIGIARGEENFSAKYSPGVQSNRDRVRKLSNRIFSDLYSKMHAAGEVGDKFSGETLRKRFLAPYETSRARR